MKVLEKINLFFEAPKLLYVYCKTCNRKFYIASKAETRSEMLQSFYLTCPYLHDNHYVPKEVRAQKGIAFDWNMSTPAIKIDRFNNSI